MIFQTVTTGETGTCLICLISLIGDNFEKQVRIHRFFHRLVETHDF